MDEVKQLLKDIKAGKLKPIYFLMGDEPYFIDLISQYIEKNLLPEDQKGFNQMVFYGRDVSIEDIVSSAKRYPMRNRLQSSAALNQAWRTPAGVYVTPPAVNDVATARAIAARIT